MPLIVPDITQQEVENSIRASFYGLLEEEHTVIIIDKLSAEIILFYISQVVTTHSNLENNLINID